MIGADQMIVAGGGGDNAPEQGAAPDGGGWRAIDAHSLEFAVPLQDEQQDVTLVGQPLSGPNNTVAVVTRRLRTCDPWDKEVKVGVPQTVSWAYGRAYPRKHRARGNSAVVFVPEADTDHLWTANANATSSHDEHGGAFSDTASGPLEPILTVDAVMPNITVPSNATTNYLCTHLALPSDRKYHIVGMRSIVQSPLIHHMILFACEDPPPAGGGVYSCLGIGGGPGCNQFFLGWAPGQMGFLLPPTVGLPMGEPGSTFFALQIHYNNPDAVEGEVDASGFQVLYTPQLRQYDAAVLTLGQRAIVIPPGQPIVTLQPNVCPSTCTARLRAPLRLLVSGLHMHTLGRAIATQHIRNGTELPPVGTRRFYDFNFQSADAVPLASSLLLPGDSLVTTCSYDSTSRINVTTYGESTTDEMCYNFLLYYPRADFTVCTSMDSAGDPGVALCGGPAQVAAVGGALQQLQQAAAAAGAGPPSGPLDLASVPALAPLVESGALVRVPPNDTAIAEPYDRQCPDLSYGLPLQEHRELALQAQAEYDR